MTKKGFVSFFLVFAVLLSLTSCTSAAQKALIGRWEIQIEDEELGTVAMVYHFTESGQIFLEQREGDKIPFSIPFGTWKIKRKQMTIISDGEENVFSFSISDETLRLSQANGEELVFQRV